MFFLKLFKKTNIKKHTEFKYQLHFWNKTYGVGDLQETHRLDYVAESWVVTTFSSVDRHLVYDTATLFSFYQYLNKHNIILQISEMSRDFEAFPDVKRGHFSYFKEYGRVKLLQKFEYVTNKENSKWNKLKSVLPLIWTTGFENSNLFLKTNLRFRVIPFFNYSKKNKDIRIVDHYWKTLKNKKIIKPKHGSRHKNRIH